MGAHVFISYSSKDSKSARAICSALESRGLSCWISSRDVGPGESFMDAIVNAISVAKVMVLVFSENANNSEDIKREIVLASSGKVTIIPVRVEDVVPKGAFAYQFATRQWIDLFEDWEAQIERLAKWIAGATPTTPSAQASSEPKNSIPDGPTMNSNGRAQEEAQRREGEETRRKKSEAEAQRIAEDNQRQQAEARIAEEQRQQQAEAERLAQEEKGRIDAAAAARLAEEEAQRKRDEAETQRIAEEQTQQQAEAERLAQAEKDRIHAAEAARLADEETQKIKAASGAAVSSENEAPRGMFAGMAAIAAFAAFGAIAIGFLVHAQYQYNIFATPDQICAQASGNTALAACNQVVALNPKDDNAYLNRCIAYINMGNYSAGLADCNQAIALNPKDDNAYVDRCITNWDLGRYKAGLADCSQAIVLNPKNGIAYDNRALTYEKLGENAEAIADYQKTLTINPSDQYAKDALKRLGR